MPLEQIERAPLRVRAAPTAEELPCTIADADHEQCADVLSVDTRHSEVQSIAERLYKRREVPEIVDPELVALGDRPEHAMKPRQVGRLLRHDAFALGLVDVLPRLLAHRAEHRLGVLREIHEQSSPRLHVHGRSTYAVLLECLRSEERRVGKECRSRWSPYH